MKKLTLFLLIVLLFANVFSFSVAFAETDSIYDLVYNTVKQVYDIEIENYQVSKQDGHTIYCSFKGGYAVVENRDEEYIIQRLWCDTTEYFSNYWGAGTFTKQTYTVSYVNKTENNKSLALRNPNYRIGEVTCVPNAATCILGFYDRYYDELIPNFTAGRSIAGNYMYSGADDNVVNVAKQLAYDMGVSNPATDGVTVSNFKSGMKTYCARKSLNVSFLSCMSWGQFNYDSATSYLNSNTPIIIFTSTFNLSSISTSNNVDTIDMDVSNSTHAMAVFGYLEITYNLSNGDVKTDKYLRVASGENAIVSTMVSVDTNIKIDDAYAITIS